MAEDWAKGVAVRGVSPWVSPLSEELLRMEVRGPDVDVVPTPFAEGSRADVSGVDDNKSVVTCFLGSVRPGVLNKGELCTGSVSVASSGPGPPDPKAEPVGTSGLSLSSPP